METIEIIIYISTAIIIAGAIILVVGKMSNSGIYDNVKNLFSADEEASFEKVDNQTIGPLLFRTWDSCGLGSVAKNVTFQFEGEESFSKTDLFSYIKRMRLCRTLSSIQEECGSREDVQMPEIEPGRIYVAQCQPQAVGGKLVIS